MTQYTKEQAIEEINKILNTLGYGERMEGGGIAEDLYYALDLLDKGEDPTKVMENV